MPKTINNISRSLSVMMDDITSDNVKIGESINDLEYDNVEETILSIVNNKQNKIDENLLTDSKDITDAINELKTASDDKLNKTNESLMTESKDVIGAINEIKMILDNGGIISSEVIDALNDLTSTL